MNKNIHYDRYVLQTILAKYMEQNETVEKRESSMIELFTNMRQERGKSSEIEDRIKTAISTSEKYGREKWSGDQTFHPDVHAEVDHYPRLGGRHGTHIPLARERVHPRSRYTRFDLDLVSRSLNNTRRRKYPSHDLKPCFDRVLDCYYNTNANYGQVEPPSYGSVSHSYGESAVNVPKRGDVREASPECHRRRWVEGTRPDDSRWFDDQCDKHSTRFQPRVKNNTMNFDRGPVRTSADTMPCEQNDSTLNCMMNLSPSIQGMILDRYERTPVNSPDHDDNQNGADSNTCRVTSESGGKYEETSHPTHQHDQLASMFPQSKSVSRNAGNAFQTHLSLFCNPYSDSTSNESVEGRKCPRPNTNRNSGSVVFEDYLREIYKRQYAVSSAKQDSSPQGRPINDNLDKHCVEYEPHYEFDESYSNNFLTFLIRNCLPKSLLRSHYSSSYNWSSENKEDILTKTQEIDIIKKIICEELDYRESVKKPFKIHRDDRRVLLRNIMYAEAVKLGLSKGLPICGVMALFAETRAAENVKQLALQTIRQANEILGENRSDPVDLEAIIAAAVECAEKLRLNGSRTRVLSSNKLSKILQDVISREPILDPRDTLHKCIEGLKNLKNFEGVNETQALNENDSLILEICRLKNIIWSVHEHTVVRSLREKVNTNRSNGGQSEKSVGSARIESSQESALLISDRLAPTTVYARDSLIIEYARLKRVIKEMKSTALISIPCDTNMKEIERKSESTNNTLSESNAIPGTKLTEEVYCQSKTSQQHKVMVIENTSMIKRNFTEDCALDEREIMKREVHLLKGLVESMEHRLDVRRGTKEPQYEQFNPHQIEDVKSKHGTELFPIAQSKDCVSSGDKNKNIAQKRKKVFYLVPNKGDKAFDEEINPNGNIQTPCMTPNTNQTTIQKDKPSTMCHQSGRECGKNKSIATQTCDDAFCEVRAEEQAATKSCCQVLYDSADLLSISSDSVQFPEFCSSQSLCTSTDSYSSSIDVFRFENKSSESVSNKTILKRRNINPAQKLWGNMVDAVTASTPSKLCLHTVEKKSQTEGLVMNSLSKAADSRFNRQSEENFFKIVHKSGSAYEISSASNIDDQTTCPTPDKKCAQKMVDDVTEHVDTNAQDQEELIKESLVARYEQAINDTLKEIIYGCSQSKSCANRVAKMSKAKKTSKKRPKPTKVEKTAVSDCSSHYSNKDIVVLGTTETNEDQHAPINQSFSTVITYSSRQKKMGLSAVKNTSSSSKIDNSDLSRTKKIPMTEKETSQTPISGANPKMDSLLTSSAEEGMANRVRPCGICKSKSQKDSSTEPERQIGNKTQISSGKKVTIKKGNAAGSRKATPKTTDIHYKRSDKESTKTTIARKRLKESDICQNSGKTSNGFKKISGAKCISSGTVSRKIPTKTKRG